MKLRLHRDSIRFRLSPADVATLTATGEVRETTGFAAGLQFAYSIELDAGADEPHVTFAAGEIRVALPTNDAHAWADGDAVGIRHEQPAGPGRTLAVLIEKDFECLDVPGAAADEVFFPNPKNACG